MCDSQPCLRTQDILEVGDTSHTTFFEMLGNWSFGDYFKKEQLAWFWQFLTEELKLPRERLWVTCYGGSKEVEKDTEAYGVWRKIGVASERIIYRGDNWWSRSGQPEKMPGGEIGGPDSEVFFEFEQVVDEKYGKEFYPDSKRFLEIGNSVFIEYKKEKDGTLRKLPQRNVDFGGGLERLTAATNNEPDVFKIDVFKPMIERIEEVSGKKYKGNEREMRVIVDHIRAVTFMIAECVPIISSDRHGSIVRKLIDRILDESRKLDIDTKFLPLLSSVVISDYKNSYPILDKKSSNIINALTSIESRVEEILVTPSREAPPEEITNLPNMSNQEILVKMRVPYQKLFGSQVERYVEGNSFSSLPSVYAGTLAFEAKTTEGRPVSSVEVDTRGSLSNDFNVEEFYKSFNDYLEQHKKISRKAGEKLFKGGLADHSREVTALHTATHLLHAALRKVLGEHVSQKGSNITAERLRFDFTHGRKMTDEEIKKVEKHVNEQIDKDLVVTVEVMSLGEAKKAGALAFFGERYEEKVKVYSIGNFSKEVCGGPHVGKLSEMGGHVKIKKEEAVSAGVRRIYAYIE